MNILVPITCITSGHHVIMTERFAEMKGNHEQHYYIFFCVCVYFWCLYNYHVCQKSSVCCLLSHLVINYSLVSKHYSLSTVKVNVHSFGNHHTQQTLLLEAVVLSPPMEIWSSQLHSFGIVDSSFITNQVCK